MPKTSKNQRQHPRLEVVVSVRMKGKSRLQEFFSRNLSEGGVFLEVNEFLPLHSRVTLALEIPGREKFLELEAEVVHQHRFVALDNQLNEVLRKGLGLRFIEVSEEQRQLIKEYVAGQAVALRS